MTGFNVPPPPIVRVSVYTVINSESILAGQETEGGRLSAVQVAMLDIRFRGQRPPSGRTNPLSVAVPLTPLSAES